ncbi:MAG: hypothetical protein VX321_01595 [Actinomycetota bacterium]|nr:hypothetical protein [Actinomycetota bacterium]
MSYRYVNRVPRQWAALYPAVLLFWIVPLVAFDATAEVVLWNIPALLVVLVAIRAFMTLTISVADGEVVTVFHWGWPRRRIALAEVTSQRVTTHGARYGWGIRFVPGGTLWRVWGRGSVELTLADKERTFSIGTADPEGLLAAIATAPRSSTSTNRSTRWPIGRKSRRPSTSALRPEGARRNDQ